MRKIVLLMSVAFMIGILSGCNGKKNEVEKACGEVASSCPYNLPVGKLVKAMVDPVLDKTVEITYQVNPNIINTGSLTANNELFSQTVKALITMEDPKGLFQKLVDAEYNLAVSISDGKNTVKKEVTYIDLKTMEKDPMTPQMMNYTIVENIRAVLNSGCPKNLEKDFRLISVSGNGTKNLIFNVEMDVSNAMMASMETDKKNLKDRISRGLRDDAFVVLSNIGYGVVYKIRNTAGYVKSIDINFTPMEIKEIQNLKSYSDSGEKSL